MSVKIISNKLIMRKQNNHYEGFCSKLFEVSTTSVTLPERHVKHAPESENLRGSGLPQLPLMKNSLLKTKRASFILDLQGDTSESSIAVSQLSIFSLVGMVADVPVTCIIINVPPV